MVRMMRARIRKGRKREREGERTIVAVVCEVSVE